MAMSFEAWKSVVDKILLDLCGMTSDDIDDWHYWTDFDDGRTPRQSAVAALKNAMSSYMYWKDKKMANVDENGNKKAQKRVMETTNTIDQKGKGNDN